MRGPRIGHAERAEVMGRLNAAHEAGLLPVDAYDGRVAAIGTATYAGELQAQLAGLPPEYGWGPPAPPPAPAAAGRVALILGLASVPLSFCLIGGVLGILAVLASRGGGPVPGGPRVTAALIGRIFGILGVVLSIGAGIALLYARTGP